MPETQHEFLPSIARPRRVAALISTADISGPGRQLVALAVELARAGVEFTIVLLLRPGALQSFAEFARRHGIACHIVTDRGPFDRAAVRAVDAFIREWRPDVVQTHSYKQTAIMYLLRRMGVAGASGWPAAMRTQECAWVALFEGQTDKNAKDRIYTRIESAMLPAADRLVVMSQLQRRMFPRRPERVRVVHNSVPAAASGEITTGLPEILRRVRGGGPVPLIGVVGRLSREKGVDVFLDSMARLKSRGVRATGVIVGDGTERARLEAQAQTLGLAGDIVFAGRIEAMTAVYRALDLLVIPSRSEGLPSVLLEAMQQDLPVVSTRVGAMIEIAAEYPQALDIVAPENPVALAEGIAGALDRLAAPERAAARAAVVAAFSSERRGRQMLQVYSEAMAQRGHS